MSKGEEQIARILLAYGVRFQREQIIQGVKKRQSLRYDFGIYNSKNELTALIEVNGGQHYYQVKQFQQTKQDFMKQQEYDRIKIAAALARNIPIYIIPYNELDNIGTLEDIFQSKFLAKTKFHNDLNNPYNI